MAIFAAPRPSLAKPASPAPARRKHWILYSLFFTLYVAYAWYFYTDQASPYLDAMDLDAPRMLADSITYKSICIAGQYYFDWLTFRDIGPCIALNVTSYNLGLLSIINGAMIVAAVLWLCRVYDREWEGFLVLTLINPVTFLSIFGPNKEVFGLVSVITLAVFLRSRSMLALFICLTTAFFTRVPAFVTTALFCLGTITVLPLRRQLTVADRRRYVAICVLITIVLTVIVLLSGSELQYSFLGDVSGAEIISQATAISLSFETLSQFGLYFVTYLLRLGLNLYSGIVGLATLGRGGVGIYYGIGVAGSSLAFALATLIFLIRGRAPDLRDSAFSWNIFLYAFFTTIVICVSPVIQHRYFYPLYIILLLYLTRPVHFGVTIRRARTPLPAIRPAARAVPS